MLKKSRQLVLALLKVPPEPQPPAGQPESVQIFRAAPNYLRLRLAVWTGSQVLALAGVIFWLSVLNLGRVKWQSERSTAAASAPVLGASTNAGSSVSAPSEGTSSPPAERRSQKRQARTRNEFSVEAARVISELPPWAVPVLLALEFVGFGFFLGQAFVSYTVLRLDYEQRWYMVTDRSLRIRSGVWSVGEMTMSFANLQQVTVTQGPIQRWLGLADLRVESAGGGGGQPGHPRASHSLHVGCFHGVGNASEIRDLILERLRQYRATGLGDPEELSAPGLNFSAPPTPATVAAAREALAAARALRIALESSRSPGGENPGP